MSLVHLVVEDESASDTSAVSVLDELVDELEAGQSNIAGVSGPIGSGRSFLLRHAVSRARSLGLGVTLAPCPPSESEIPYAVVTRLLSELLPPERIADLAVSCERAPCASDLNALLCREFTALAAGRPLLVAVDDLHWADRWSRNWFAEMAGRAPETPILLLGSAHGPLERVVDAAAPIQLRLPPFSVRDIADLLTKATGHPVEEAVARATARAAMGRPAVAAAVAGHFAATGQPLTPPRLTEVYEVARRDWSERITRVVRTLPLDAVALLRAMAVGGRDFGFEMTAALAQPRSAGVLDALEILVDAGLVVGGGTPRLACPSVAVDAFSGRDAAERAALGMRAAELGRAVEMGALTVAELLGGVPVAGQQWVGEVFAEASECLLREGKRAAAVAALRRALREPMAEAARARLLIRLAGLEVVDLPEASDGRLRQVLIRHTGLDTWSPVVEAADLLLSRGDAETTRRLVSDVHREAAATRPRAQLTPLAALGWLAQDEAGPDLETPAAVLPAPPPVPRDGAEAAVLAWQLASRAEDRPRVLELARTALAEDSGAPLMCRFAAARALMCADEFGEAYAGYESVVRLARRRGARAAAAQALLAQAGLILRRSGEAEHALAGVEAAKLELPPESWHPALGSRLTAAEIMANIRLGRLDAARQLAYRQSAQPADHGVGWSFLLFARAELLLVGGEPDRALVLFEECGRVLLSRGWRNPVLLPWRFGASLAHQLLGATEEALALRAEEDAVLERWGVADALALPGEGALAAFRAIGLEIPDLPAQPDDRAPAADPLAALTPVEREVVLLVLGGKANGEVAAELGVTRRTVELRLTKVYRKLAVRGRDELLARLGAAVSRC
ncbi:LuxR family transcriptional regulator [Crossiella sp. CA-258035]|uniref:helix-turn-helix transcriptional regulator n=1 Tax=Crossiella sp. CA-258035 TaxID=2981138 RepID=UPI0024BD3C52|nr:LuxR family transcriptional regulator [Crossiella sp. CA-258035]WHT16660.1 LuxR family transcriptional regulator [Crossiella sp. CA-258035]